MAISRLEPTSATATYRRQSTCPPGFDQPPIVHADQFVARSAAEPKDARRACRQVADDVLAAASAYLADGIDPITRPRIYDFYSEHTILRLPDGSVWAGWSSGAGQDDPSAGQTAAALSAAFGVANFLNLEWTGFRVRECHCVPLDSDTVVVHFESLLSMVDHEAEGRRGTVHVLGSDTLTRHASAHYGWRFAIRDYRSVRRRLEGRS
jgi:hypothetical protein